MLQAATARESACLDSALLTLSPSSAKFLSSNRLSPPDLSVYGASVTVKPYVRLWECHGVHRSRVRMRADLGNELANGQGQGVGTTSPVCATQVDDDDVAPVRRRGHEPEGAVRERGQR